MHDHTGTDHAPHEGIVQLSHSLERTLNQNRALLEEMAHFTKDETLRLAHMQLDHASQAFTYFHERHNLGGMIGAQQEWIKQMMQEYATLGLRYAEMFQSVTRHVQSHVESAAADLRHEAEEEMEDLDHGLEEMPRAHNGMDNEQSHLPAE